MSHRLHPTAGLLLALLAPAVVAAPTSIDPRIDQLMNALGKVQVIDAVTLSPDGTQLAW